mgnify:CR=1 FL=1
MTTRFETGKTYQCRSFCDYDTIITGTVLRRTEKTITMQLRDKEKVQPPKFLHGTEIEYVNPWGKYSMAPIMSADREATGGC